MSLINDHWDSLEADREYWQSSKCCGAPLIEEQNMCSHCKEYALSRSAAADMRAAKAEYDAATPAERAKVIQKAPPWGKCYVEPEEDECPHDELDHGICLDCGKDCFDDEVAAAEFAADCRENR